jgi:hypothetical protein
MTLLARGNAQAEVTLPLKNGNVERPRQQPSTGFQRTPMEIGAQREARHGQAGQERLGPHRTLLRFISGIAG